MTSHITQNANNAHLLLWHPIIETSLRPQDLSQLFNNAHTLLLSIVQNTGIWFHCDILFMVRLIPHLVKYRSVIKVLCFSVFCQILIKCGSARSNFSTMSHTFLESTGSILVNAIVFNYKSLNRKITFDFKHDTKRRYANLSLRPPLTSTSLRDLKISHNCSTIFTHCF